MFAFDERLKSLGWSDFPFRIDVMPEIFAGEKRLLNPLTVQLRTGNIILIEGGRGTGKSHILRWFNDFLSSSNKLVPCLISEPLDSTILTETLIGLLKEQLMVKTKTTPDRVDVLAKKIRTFYKQNKQRIVLLIDDGQSLALTQDDSEKEEKEKRKTVRWLRVLSDLPAVVVFIAGLTGFSKALTTIFPPIAERVTLQFSLEQEGYHGIEVLNEKETAQLIRQRIEYFGGKGITPFTNEALEEIHVHTRGYPRSVLRFCENILTLAFQDDTPAGDRITPDFVRHAMKQRPSPPPVTSLMPSALDQKRFIETSPVDEADEWFEEFDELTATQREILVLAKDKKCITSALVAEEVGITKGTASNELKKLHDREKLQRRKGYRGFEYLPR
ncbi:MAG: AAA family ATPase [Candidatus Hermodarchaeia archaeon]|jgi:type II secretory pathway predicted ATPase ExeA